ncbi:MAG: redoxin domain-containing protein [Taibaiella sp.]|nr:redoxin domain-containing protein [Taibaiella sp.]
MHIRQVAANGLLFVTLLISNKTTMAQHKKIAAQQHAPLFTTTDVNGKTVELKQFRGRKVLLTFHRNVGCPICNLRFHELEKMAGSTPDLVLLAVYESSADNMRKYLDGSEVHTVMIPDTAQALYQLYGVERSKGKIMKGMLHGGMGKIKAGKKLFTQNIKQDGNMDRIGADFVIDEHGKVLIAHYDSYVGGHLPVHEILSMVGR